MVQKNTIKFGALAVLILFIIVLAFYYVLMKPKGKKQEANIVRDPSQGMQGMQHGSGIEGQMQGNRSSPEFVGVKITPEKQQLIGIKTEEVTTRKLVKNIRTVGFVEADERKIAHVHVKLSGWIKDMFVYEGQYVKHGDPLFTIYSPDLVSSQEEYLIALKAKDDLNKSPFSEISSGANSLLEAARRRFFLWGISESELKSVEKTGKPLTYMTIYSHVSGYITKRMYFPGMHVLEHEDVLVLADLSTVWVLADVYEYELPLVKEGQVATLELSYYPGETFTGRVMYIYPTIELSTRTAKVRFEFPNPDNRLKPGMYVNVRLENNMGEKLSVPEDSVIDTGERKIVFVAKGDGYFEPREVKVGQRAEGNYEVIDGLQGGELVVRSAVFLIDSESRIKAALQSFGGGKEETITVGGGEIRGKSSIKISFTTDPDPPQSGNTNFKFKLTDYGDKPITGAKVKFTIIMPAMLGMAEMRSTGEAKHVGAGIYVGKINIPVSGTWALAVETLVPKKPAVNESFDLNVR